MIGNQVQILIACAAILAILGILFLILYRKSIISRKDAQAEEIAPDKPASTETSDNKQIISEAAPTAENARLKKLNKLFEAYIQDKKPYLEAEFSLEDVCSELDTNRTYASKMISEYYDMSFRDYVNSLRISAAKEILLDSPELNLEDVAEQSGFASASQFVRKFKELTGTTPGAFRKK